jgi:predicted RNA-binding Zn-ribbon protein involved in translation (DUF1610 family)
MAVVPDELGGRARVCVRCGQVTTPRNGRVPHFCANCGQILDPGRAPRARNAGSAVASLVLGCVAFVPICGFPVGLFAIALGGAAKQQIKRSAGQVAGNGMATLGIVLGAVGAVIQALICLGAR